MRHVWYAILIAAVYGCGTEAQVTDPPEARAHGTRTSHYEIVKLRSLGGTQSRGMAINDRGWVAGWSNLANGRRRAVLWKDHRSITNLETLGGRAAPCRGSG